MFIVGSIVSVVLANDGSPTATVLLIGSAIGELLVIFYLYLTQRNQQQNLALTKTSYSIPLLLLIGMGAGITVDLIAAAGNRTFHPIPELTNINQEGIFGLVIAGIFLLFIQPIAEEIIFRGVLVPKLRELTSGIMGIIIGGILYGGFHYLAYATALENSSTQLWYGIIAPSILGIFYGVIRVYTGSTRATILTHIGANLLFFLIALILAT